MGGVRRAESVAEVSRPESPASIAIKSLELDGAKAADLKVRVEANERALDDLQKVQSKAGNIANMAAEGDFLFGGDQVKEEPFVATKDARGKITEVNYQGTTDAAVEDLGSGFTVTTDIPGENTETTGAIGLVKDSRTGGDLFGNLISLRDNLLANEKEAIVERDIPALRKDAEHLIQHFGEVSANQMMLDTVQALAADIEGEDGKSMSTVDKLGNIQYALHRALVDNRNFTQQDSFKAVD